MDICFALLSARQSDILYTSAQNRVIKLIHCMQNKMQPISDVIPAFWLNWKGKSRVQDLYGRVPVPFV